MQANKDLITLRNLEHIAPAQILPEVTVGLQDSLGESAFWERGGQSPAHVFTPTLLTTLLQLETSRKHSCSLY